MNELISITPKEFQNIRTLVYKNVGINLTDQKQSLVASRLQKILREYGFTNFKQYYDYVISDTTGQALSTLVNRISTNHTFFYRENDHFKYLSQRVLPELAMRLKSEKNLRIWCAGCSSGEEPYTLAMLLLEYFGKDMLFWKVGILATDISTNVLETAKRGKYDEENIRHLPPEFVEKYFTRIGNDSWQVRDNLKKVVLFKRLNLLRESYPFKGTFNIIFCRNVMIYFDKVTREGLIQRFYRYTEPGGYLFTGHSESIGRGKRLFRYLQPAVYVKDKK